MLLLSPLEVSWAYQQNTEEGGCPPDDPNEVITPTLHSRCQQSADYSEGLYYQSYTLNFIFYSVAEMGFREKVFFLA